MHQRPLPDWLSQTFSSLAPDNPLRALVPDDGPIDSPRGALFHATCPYSTVPHTGSAVQKDDDDVFAFTAPDPPPEGRQLIEETPSLTADHYAEQDGRTNTQDALANFTGENVVLDDIHASISPPHVETQEERRQYSPAAYAPSNAFSTPGPASIFSLASPARALARMKSLRFQSVQPDDNDDLSGTAYFSDDPFVDPQRQDRHVGIPSIQPFRSPGPIFQVPMRTEADLYYDTGQAAAADVLDLPFFVDAYDDLMLHSIDAQTWEKPTPCPQALNTERASSVREPINQGREDDDSWIFTASPFGSPLRQSTPPYMRVNSDISSGDKHPSTPVHERATKKRRYGAPFNPAPGVYISPLPLSSSEEDLGQESEVERDPKGRIGDPRRSPDRKANDNHSRARVDALGSSNRDDDSICLDADAIWAVSGSLTSLHAVDDEISRYAVSAGADKV